MSKKRDATKSLKSKELHVESRISQGGEAKRRRVRFDCKPQLQSIFVVVNLIPPDQDMECPYVSSGGNLHKPGSKGWIDRERQTYAAFQEYLKSFPEIFRVFISSITKDELDSIFQEMEKLSQDMDEASAIAYWNKIIGIQKGEIHLYESIRAMRKNLYRLAEIGQNADKYLGQSLDDVTLGVLLVENAYLDKEGRIRRQPNPFAETIEGVEVSRIRACLVCRKLFWAQRKDKRCCSDEHSIIIRQRQSRKNKKEKGKIYSKFAKLRKQRHNGKHTTKKI